MPAEAPGVIELVARMRREAFSRNRHFDEFAESPEGGARALRLWRFLRSLERDLRLAASGAERVTLLVERTGEDARRITIEVPRLRLRRVATLTAAEYELLLEDDSARAALAAGS